METWWQEITSSVATEFSDVPTIGHATRITLRILIAALLSGVLGYERQRQGKAAGLRTHMLVGIGAAVFVLVPQQAGVSDADNTRVIQGLVAGIGFLGAGTILKGEGERVHGLTTAAGIWLTAAIGVAAGLGRETTAILSTLFAFAILALLPRIEAWFRPEKHKQSDILQG